MDLRSIVNNDPEDGPQQFSQGRRSTVASLLNGSSSSVAGSHSDAPAHNGDERSNSASTSTPVSTRPKKPKKYDTPPIWAQCWGDKENRVPSRPLGPKSEPPPPLLAGVRDRGDQTLMKTPPSITGVIPSQDIVLKICAWLYSHLHQLDYERQHVEVEFKFGTICEMVTRRRALLPVVSEALLSSDYVREKLYFSADLGDGYFAHLEQMLHSLATKQPGAPLSKLPDTRTVDSIHHLPSDGGNIRISRDAEGNVVEKIVKKRISDLMICSPGDLVDFRISLSTEAPYNGPDNPPARATLSRRKNRQSWQSPGLKFDVTSVLSDGHTAAEPSTKEAEIELDQRMLLDCYNEFQTAGDPAAMQKFQELIQLGLDNCRVIAREISREAK